MCTPSFYAVRAAGHTAALALFFAAAVSGHIAATAVPSVWTYAVGILAGGLVVEAATELRTLVRLWPFFAVALRVRTGLLPTIFVRLLAAIVAVAAALAAVLFTLALASDIASASAYAAPLFALAPLTAAWLVCLGLFVWIRARATAPVSLRRTYFPIHLLWGLFVVALALKLTLVPSVSWWLVFLPVWLVLAAAVVTLCALLVYVCGSPIPSVQRYHFLLLYSAIAIFFLAPATTAAVVLAHAFQSGASSAAYHVVFAALYVVLVASSVAFAIASRRAAAARRRRERELIEAQAALARALDDRHVERRRRAQRALLASNSRRRPRRSVAVRSARVGPPPLPEVAIYEDDDAFAATTQETCVICFDNAANVVLQECGHNEFCAVCARQVRTCPLCRAPIAGIIVRLPESSRALAANDPVARAALEATIRLEHHFHRVAFDGRSRLSSPAPSPHLPPPAPATRTRQPSSPGSAPRPPHLAWYAYLNIFATSSSSSSSADDNAGTSAAVASEAPVADAPARLPPSPPAVPIASPSLSVLSSHSRSFSRSRGHSRRASSASHALLADLAEASREPPDPAFEASITRFLTSIPLPSSLIPLQDHAAAPPSPLSSPPPYASEMPDDVSLGISSTTSASSSSNLASSSSSSSSSSNSIVGNVYANGMKFPISPKPPHPPPRPPTPPPSTPPPH